jgi:hypothetical protein
MDDSRSGFTVMARLEKLERENRFLKRLGLIVLLAVGAVVAMAQVPAKRTVIADEFVLKDSAGKVRARLQMDRGAPSLLLYDASGAGRAELRQNALMLYSSPSDLFGDASLILDSDGPTLLLNSAKHNSTMGLSSWWPLGPGPALHIADSEGYQAVIGAAETQNVVNGESHKTSAAAITLFGKDAGVIWKAP